MDHLSLINNVPINTTIYRGFCIAMFDYQKVECMAHGYLSIFDKGLHQRNGQVYVWHLLHKAWSSKGGKPLVAGKRGVDGADNLVLYYWWAVTWDNNGMIWRIYIGDIVRMYTIDIMFSGLDVSRGHELDWSFFWNGKNESANGERTWNCHSSDPIFLPPVHILICCSELLILSSFAWLVEV